MRASPLRLLAAALLAAALLLAPACSRSAATVAAATSRKTLLVGNGAEPQDLDPHLVTGVPEHHILKALLEGLVIDHPSGEGVAPGVAERWETSHDGLTWTFHLRADARWSNGDAVTARDFVRSYQRFLTPSLGAQYAYFLYHVVGAEEFNQGKLTDFSLTGFHAPDDRTLVITLKHRVPFLLESLKHYAWWPVHWPSVEKYGRQWTRPGNFVGNGPFALAEWRPQQHILATKSPTYWDAAHTRLDAIKFFPVDNADTEERMFRTGQLHVTGGLPLPKISGYREHHPDEFRSDPYYGTSFLRFNTTRKPFNDPRVRRAFALAIDREAYVHTLRGGQQPALNFTPASAAFTSRARLATDASAKIEEARRLLAEAGYPDGRDFPPVNLLYVTNNTGKELAETFQQMCRTALGIDIRLRNEEWKVYLDSQNSLNYDLCRAGWIGDYPDPHSFLDMWESGGGNNLTGYANPDYDRLLKSALLAPDETARMEIYQQLETILMRDLPIVPVNFHKTIYLLSPKVKNWVPNLLDNRGWQYLDLAD